MLKISFPLAPLMPYFFFHSSACSRLTFNQAAMVSVNCWEEIGRDVVNLKECSEKIIKLVLVAPKSIKSRGSELFSPPTKDLAMACGSISKTKGFNPALRKIGRASCRGRGENL